MKLPIIIWILIQEVSEFVKVIEISSMIMKLLTRSQVETSLFIPVKSKYKYKLTEWVA